MVLLVAAHRLTEVTVKLSAWTAVSTDLTVLEGWLTSRHLHVTAGRRHPGAARNMAFAIVSGQRETKNRSHRVSYDLILEVVSHHFCCTLLSHNSGILSRGLYQIRIIGGLPEPGCSVLEVGMGSRE